jgi:hypothetical protein
MFGTWDSLARTNCIPTNQTPDTEKTLAIEHGQSHFSVAIGSSSNLIGSNCDFGSQLVVAQLFSEI